MAYYTAVGRRLGLTDIDHKRCALIIVDIQEGIPESIKPVGSLGYTLGRLIELVGVYNSGLLEAYQKRLNETVFPNLEKLIEFFRSKNMPAVYTVLGSAGVHRRLSPRKDEWVINKYASGAFGNTILDKVLRDNGIDTIFLSGTDTAGCVLSTAFGALDRGYRVIVVEDACISNRADTHEAAVKILELFSYAQTAERVIADYPWQGWIDREPAPPAK